MSGKRTVIGMDVGATNIRSARVDATGTLLARDRRPTCADQGRDTVVEHIVGSIHAVSDDTVEAVGIGVPGPLDPDTGIVYAPPNMTGWGDEPLRDLVAYKIGKRVALENDANAWGLGEAWLGAGRDRSSLILLTLGTGIGGCLVLGGRPWHGAHNVGCEIGHIVYDPDGVPCGCGSRGCLEQYASATGIARRAAEGIEGGAKTTLRVEGLTSASVHEAAVAGDAFAREIIEETGRILGVGLTTLCNFFDPELIVVGGGAAAAGEMLFDPMRAELAARAIQMPAGLPPIVPPQLGEDAGILGAARLVME